MVVHPIWWCANIPSGKRFCYHNLLQNHQSHHHLRCSEVGMLTATHANEVRARNLCKPHFLLSPSPQSHEIGLSIYWNNSRPVEVTRAIVSKLSSQKIKVHYYPDLQNIMNRKMTRMTVVILKIKIFVGIIGADCPAVP